MQKLYSSLNSIRLYYNYLAQALSYFTRSQKVYSYPIVFQIELTNHCPMNCIMCPRQYMKRKLGYISFDLFKKVVDQVKVYDEQINLYHFGDPLMHPQAAELIKYCHEKGIKVNCSVNPTLLTKDISKKIIDAGLNKLFISLDSIDNESYKKIRGSMADYDKAVNNITYLLDLKAKRNSNIPHITISLIYMNSTKNSVEAFKRKWQQQGVDEICIKPFTGFGLKSLLEYADNSSIERIENKAPYPCFRPWRSITVLWDGRVVPCCYDYDSKYVIGDLNKESLDEIWNGRRMRELRRQHILNDFSENILCGSCNEGYGWPSFAQPLKLSGYAYRKIAKVIKGKP